MRTFSLACVNHSSAATLWGMPSHDKASFMLTPSHAQQQLHGPQFSDKRPHLVHASPGASRSAFAMLHADSCRQATASCPAGASLPGRSTPSPHTYPAAALGQGCWPVPAYLSKSSETLFDHMQLPLAFARHRLMLVYFPQLH